MQQAEEVLMPAKSQTLITRLLANFFSIVFHPVFMPTYLAAYLLYIDNLAYVGVEERTKQFILIRIFGTNTLLPLVVVIISKGLGFVSSVKLNTQRDRIIPYVACITFFFWTYYVSKNLNDPVPMQSMLLGVFLSAIAALMANIYYKISMHAIGAGGLIGLMSVLLFTTGSVVTIPLIIATLIAGLLCTSRFVVSDHTPFEIYSGLFAGFFLQWIGWLFT